MKFCLQDVAAMGRALRDLGASSHGRVFESNLLFDDPGETLAKKKCLLRLRKDNSIRLTFKSPAAEEAGTAAAGPSHRADFKTLKEIEISVDDYETTQTLLMSLGFFPVRRYEKYRETFSLDNTEVCIDAMPYGDFLEIEGEEAAILTLARRLQLAWDARITDNYLDIFDNIKKKAHLDFIDVTFENFDPSVKSAIRPILHALYRPLA